MVCSTPSVSPSHVTFPNREVLARELCSHTILTNNWKAILEIWRGAPLHFTPSYLSDIHPLCSSIDGWAFKCRVLKFSVAALEMFNLVQAIIVSDLHIGGEKTCVGYWPKIMLRYEVFMLSNPYGFINPTFSMCLFLFPTEIKISIFIVNITHKSLAILPIYHNMSHISDTWHGC